MPTRHRSAALGDRFPEPQRAAARRPRSLPTLGIATSALVRSVSNCRLIMSGIHGWGPAGRLDQLECPCPRPHVFSDWHRQGLKCPWWWLRSRVGRLSWDGWHSELGRHCFLCLFGFSGNLVQLPTRCPRPPGSFLSKQLIPLQAGPAPGRASLLPEPGGHSCHRPARIQRAGGWHVRGGKGVAPAFWRQETGVAEEGKLPSVHSGLRPALVGQRLWGSDLSSGPHQALLGISGAVRTWLPQLEHPLPRGRPLAILSVPTRPPGAAPASWGLWRLPPQRLLCPVAGTLPQRP